MNIWRSSWNNSSPWSLFVRSWKKKKTEHVALVTCLEKEAVGSFLLGYEKAQGEIYKWNPSFKIDWMEIPFELDKFLATEVEDEEKGIPTRVVPHLSNPSTSTKLVDPSTLDLPLSSSVKKDISTASLVSDPRLFMMICSCFLTLQNLSINVEFYFSNIKKLFVKICCGSKLHFMEDK